VPIVSACSIVALIIAVRVMRIEVGEHILYSGLTVLLGVAPIGFLALGWVTNPVPSGICGALSLITLILTQLVEAQTCATNSPNACTCRRIPTSGRGSAWTAAPKLRPLFTVSDQQDERYGAAGIGAS
jgi:hypothetical protein